MIKSFWKKGIHFYEKYERYISGGALFLGFIIDSLTLQRIDLFYENFVSITYLSLVALSLIGINFIDQEKFVRPSHLFIKKWLPVIIQFAFGGLFSAFFVFYSRSATLSSSIFFVLLLLALLIGNEFFKRHYKLLNFQVSIYFVTIFSFMIFYMPILIGQINVWVFLLSGITSLVIIAIFIYVLKLLVPRKITDNKKILTFSIASIYLFINLLYFTNLIPPIPLSLKESGVYYSVSRENDSYYLVEYQKNWKDYMRSFFLQNQVIPLGTGEPLYIYSAVFAPTKISTKISHSWQYYNEEKGEWVEVSRIDFPIKGGRDGGYRGYSMKNNVTSGLWRVDVMTDRDQIVGRVKFEVDRSSDYETKTSVK